MADNKMHKVQINRTVRYGKDRYGKDVNETTQMFNIRCDDVDEAVKLYAELLDKFYAEARKKRKEARENENK